MKVLGIGLPKTGTTSLMSELQYRGMTVIHGPYVVANRLGGRIPCRADTVPADAMLEWYGLWPMRAVIDMHPDAVLINTVRDFDSWIDSCERHFRPAAVPRVINGRMRRFGVNGFDSGIFRKMYERHAVEVASLQRDGHRVRNLYICDGDGAEALDGILSTGGKFAHNRKGRKRNVQPT